MIWVRRALILVVGAGTLISACIAWAITEFRSLHAARAYFRGEVIEVGTADSPITVKPESNGQVRVHLNLQNNARIDVRVMGARTDCSCVTFDGLPLQIPAHETRDFSVILPDATEPSFDRQITIFTNSDQVPKLVFDLKKRALEAEN